MNHLLPILFAIVYSVIVITYSRNKLSRAQQERVFHLHGMVVSLVVLVYHMRQILLGDYDFRIDLPLYLCSFMALVIPVFTYYRKYWMYEILIFWVVIGTSQGVITPDISEGFPALDYFRYWVVHLGLLFLVFYATYVFSMRPTLKSVIRSILALQVYVVSMMLLNYLLGANYSYLNHKPESASLLDHLGEWPWYIIKAQVLIVLGFFVVYGVFYFTRKRTT